MKKFKYFFKKKTHENNIKILKYYYFLVKVVSPNFLLSKLDDEQ